MKKAYRFIAITAVICVSMILSGLAGASTVPTLWGVDEDDGELFSIADYRNLSGFTSYGALTYNGNPLDDDIEGFVFQPGTSIAYMAVNKDVNGFVKPVLLRYDISNAGIDNNVSVVGEITSAGGDVTGLAFWGQDLLALDENGGVDDLLRLNPNNAGLIARHEIANNGLQVEEGEGMAFNDGHLLITDADGDEIFAVDPLTGSIIAELNSDAGSVDIKALAYDPVSHVLVGFDAKSGHDVFVTIPLGINPGEGSTVLGQIGALTDVESMDFVPIPGTAILLGSGVLALLGIVRRRKSKNL